MRVVGFGLDGPRSLRLFVSRPVVSPLAMASRATRGYWAVTEDNGVVFLKDTWRHTAFDLELESDILADLNKFNVRHIAHLVIHGDVHYKSPAADGGEDMEKDIVQRTQTDTFQDSEWSCTGQRKLALSPHVHYRLVTSTVGYPLAQFIGTQELLQTTFHAFEAMKDAFAHGRLHRDISLGNIILVRSRAGKQEREGCLIDWELSYLIIGKNDARAYRRTGTWQFMSLNLLTVYEQEPHSIRDDIESMFYFVLYCSL
ncbi:hypothetical protein B0H21DRAFT_893184 [Amylocystis lapponica]|nr:hypothetical protein B0H21DRAFT_893184 [Amylocystis lapponica]